MNTESLQNLGLTKNESKVFAALIRIKSGCVNDISRTAQVPRVNTYDILESLKIKGLVGTITKSNKMYFEPANPEILKDLLEKKKNSLTETKNTITQLQEIYKNSNEKKETALYKGKLGIKTVLKDALNSKTEILNYGSSGLFPKKYPEYFNIWESQRIKRKINMRIIASKSIKKDVPKKKMQDIKYINIDFKNMTSTFIYDNKVCMLMWTEDPIAIFIENAELAESYRNYFEALWNAK